LRSVALVFALGRRPRPQKLEALLAEWDGEGRSDPVTVLSVGAVLIVAIYIQTALLFDVNTPELFPTEIRLRANGICNTLGRAATVVSPFVVGFLMVNYALPGVIWLMIGLVVVQIVAVYFWGVEPARRSLEGLDPKTA
jgi:putative MFS transporter